NTINRKERIEHKKPFDHEKHEGHEKYPHAKPRRRTRHCERSEAIQKMCATKKRWIASSLPATLRSRLKAPRNDAFLIPDL
ncbi:MAG: hypothetical protein FWC38_02365, partial [Proteobacteria bacterium]|nr:hypothetical protein [Pseudomonadota bacterium]MCL2307080.1 hypothetical protein [Pseudomonadota bacterium]